MSLPSCLTKVSFLLAVSKNYLFPSFLNTQVCYCAEETTLILTHSPSGASNGALREDFPLQELCSLPNLLHVPGHTQLSQILPTCAKLRLQLKQFFKFALSPAIFLIFIQPQWLTPAQEHFTPSFSSADFHFKCSFTPWSSPGTRDSLALPLKNIFFFMPQACCSSVSFSGLTSHGLKFSLPEIILFFFPIPSFGYNVYCLKDIFLLL